MKMAKSNAKRQAEYRVKTKDNKIVVVLDDELLAKFNAHCKLNSLNKSDMLRMMIKEFSEFWDKKKATITVAFLLKRNFI